MEQNPLEQINTNATDTTSSQRNTTLGTTSSQVNAEESEHISNGFHTDLVRHNRLSYTTHGAFPDVLPNEADEEFKDFPKGLFAPTGGRNPSETSDIASNLLGYK